MAKVHVVTSKLSTETQKDVQERGREGLRERGREGVREGKGGMGRKIPVKFDKILRFCKQKVD